MSTIEGFHCIQDTSPGPQGVHNRVPHYTGHLTTAGPQGVHNREVPLYYIISTEQTTCSTMLKLEAISLLSASSHNMVTSNRAE